MLPNSSPMMPWIGYLQEECFSPWELVENSATERSGMTIKNQKLLFDSSTHFETILVKSFHWGITPNPGGEAALHLPVTLQFFATKQATHKWSCNERIHSAKMGTEVANGQSLVRTKRLRWDHKSFPFRDLRRSKHKSGKMAVLSLFNSYFGSYYRFRKPTKSNNLMLGAGVVNVIKRL